MAQPVIASAARTPIGSFTGAFARTPASELGRVAIEAALSRASLSPEAVDDVVLGHVLTAGLGQNPARQAAIAAGIPKERTAMCINQVCGSGLRAVAQRRQDSGLVPIRTGARPKIARLLWRVQPVGIRKSGDRRCEIAKMARDFRDGRRRSGFCRRH